MKEVIVKGLDEGELYPTPTELFQKEITVESYSGTGVKRMLREKVFTKDNANEETETLLYSISTHTLGLNEKDIHITDSRTLHSAEHTTLTNTHALTLPEELQGTLSYIVHQDKVLLFVHGIYDHAILLTGNWIASQYTEQFETLWNTTSLIHGEL